MEEEQLNVIVYRPWGWYKSIEGGDLASYKVKRIHVNPHKKLSLQSHRKRSEHWVIIKGTGKVTLGEEFITVTTNDYIHIPVTEKHRMENTTDEPLEFIETQIGPYLGEDDIIRYEDDWGRK